MDYKSVIEEQIRELQKVQDATSETLVDSKIHLASTICNLTFSAKAIERS
jgi:hypothetical protein